MADLQFEFEWSDEVGYVTEQQEYTFADFAIYVGDDCVTEYVALEEEERRVREAIHLPLYPVAEWIAANWWNLLYESFTSGKTDEDDYAYRHNLRYARDGFALPDLKIQPEGQEVSLHWENVKLDHYRTKFIGGGHEFIDRNDFEEALSEFLDAVYNRLSEYGITDTTFQEEWDAIREADQDEREFCKAAAKLGKYPYGLSEDQQAAIVASSRLIPEPLYDAFYAAATLDEVEEQAEGIRSLIQRLQDIDVEAEELVDLRQRIEGFEKQWTPHAEGYDFARALRTELEIEDRELRSLSDLISAIRLDGRDAEQSVLEWKRSYFYETLVATNDREVPGFAINSRSERRKKFALCRGLFEYLTTPNGEPMLVTKEHTDRQKRNRAFAAEFLAPSYLLQEDISESYVDEDKVEDLAGKYGVSSMLIAHQIENHEIANRVDTPF
ncbi:ImmA/IrrE family metallo-endopeptidase [Salinibacter ruber]|uniref:ImmA/IrrE family metallo-endopeptidase n=1 Tax=Salinibacter ruber TaxID=146919 RepID=UPI00207442EA|nr:hypothetical protein [Salinibacter ruber]